MPSENQFLRDSSGAHGRQKKSRWHALQGVVQLWIGCRTEKKGEGDAQCAESTPSMYVVYCRREEEHIAPKGEEK